MSKNLKKILVTGASLLMLASAGAGMSSMHTNAHAASQAVLAKIGESKDPDKAIAQWLAKHGGGAKAAKPMKMTPEQRRENYKQMVQGDKEMDADNLKWLEFSGFSKAKAEHIAKYGFYDANADGHKVPVNKAAKKSRGKTVAKRHAHKRLHLHRSKRNQTHKATVRRAKKARRTKRAKRVIRKHAKKSSKRSVKHQVRLTVRQRRIINGAKSNYKITSHISAKELMDLEMDNPTTPRESKEFKALNQNEKYKKAAKKAFTPRQYKRIAYLFK